ncbi:hypothetical protein [Paenibacillus silviterrae]|uniref:hypothetical protein n=1 Tax=Paenibacillus silviterrae TaxID=3242194 RepID=UPI0025429BBD|nr:hypothetical protein [Paenibacillus chinjuensis]
MRPSLTSASAIASSLTFTVMIAAGCRVIELAFEELTTDEGIAKGYPHADLERYAIRTMKKRYRRRLLLSDNKVVE